MNLSDDLLVQDFSQCFEQMRHYDDAFRRTTEFTFAGIVAVVGAYAALVGRYGATPVVLGLAGLMLAVSGGVVALFVFSLAKNRVYFALVARYVNEIRRLYVATHPGGFRNETAMYTDCNCPRIFSPGSTQTINVYLLAILSSVLISGAIGTFLLLYKRSVSNLSDLNWTAMLITFGALILLQSAGILLYWHRQESREKRRTVQKATVGGK